MSKKDDQEGKENPLNKRNNEEPLEINRGLELLLRKKRRKERTPKTFEVKFGKMISFFRREVNFFLNVYIDVKKK
jgi:hypothetical protein